MALPEKALRVLECWNNGSKGMSFLSNVRCKATIFGKDDFPS